MAFGVLNLAMLFGLAAVALPVIAHLLSKRRFDVVNWGAMQFLELGRRTRRRIRLQDWLLLLLRMLLVALVALALARPWAQGGVLGRLADAVSRDVVFVLDSSYSMDWEGKAITPHAAAINWIHTALEELQPGDTVALIDARSRQRLVVAPPVTDFKRIRDELNKLPAASGTSQLPAAITEAMQILSTTSNLSREVIVLTDGQALPWQREDAVAWERIQELRAQPIIPPGLFVVNLGSESRDLTNFAVDRIELSRQLTVPDFPIRLRTMIRQFGGVQTQRRVHLEVNGQPLESQTTEVTLLPNGEALVEFEQRFDAVGSYVVTVRTDADSLPADNKAEAVVVVAAGLPVLLVDGDPQLDPTRRETFFLKSAFDSTGETSWVKATVIPADALPQTTLADYRVVFLCNLAGITPEVAAQLTDFVHTGGTVVIAPGDRTAADQWNKAELIAGTPWLPLRPITTRTEQEAENKLVTVDHLSLQLPWLERFRKEKGVDFASARYGRWWQLEPYPASAVPAEPATSTEEVPPVQVLARLSTGDPLLVSREWGTGKILQLAIPLDADWTTLPARNDFVPFVHELVFAHAALGPSRNVDVGASLVLPLAPGQVGKKYVVTGPGASAAPAIPVEIAGRPCVSYVDPLLPGLYYFHEPGSPPDSGEPFLVDFDRSESDLQPLEPAAWEELAAKPGLRPITTMSMLTAELKQANSRTDLWWLLLFVVLALLVSEVALTRQMVKGGHAALETA
jgi:hypothetical protein